MAQAGHQLPRWPPASEPWPTDTLALGLCPLPELADWGQGVVPRPSRCPSPSATLADPSPTVPGPAAP